MGTNTYFKHVKSTHHTGLAKHEAHHTVTAEESGIMLKIWAAMTINTGLVIMLTGLGYQMYTHWKQYNDVVFPNFNPNWYTLTGDFIVSYLTDCCCYYFMIFSDHLSIDRQWQCFYKLLCLCCFCFLTVYFISFENDGREVMLSLKSTISCCYGINES